MSPERPGGGHEQDQPDRPYYRAVRFTREGEARRAYFAAQEFICTDESSSELSTYRFLLNSVWHVGVLGERPDDAAEQQLQRMLRGGLPTELPDDILDALAERREQATKQASWVERHYRSGTDL